MNSQSKSFVVLIGLVLGWISTSGKKSQIIRIMDTFIIGPLMIYVGWKESENIILRLFLIFFGSTTITYNLKNYLRFHS